MAEDTTVSFRIGESVKKEWEEAAESPEYDSLSHLIRLAVQREINDGSATDTQTESNTTTDSEVVQSLNRIEKAVTDVQDEMKALSRERQDEELFALEQVLLETLPTASRSFDPTVELEPEELRTSATTAGDIAQRIGADASDVTDALERLDEDTGQVQSAQDREERETYYWRVE